MNEIMYGECPNCQGSGKELGDATTCRLCGGFGMIDLYKKILIINYKEEIRCVDIRRKLLVENLKRLGIDD